MQTHVKVVAVLHIILGSLGVVFALFTFIAAGTVAGIVGSSAEARDAAVAVPAIGMFGALAAVFLLILGLPGIIVGIGLLYFKPWARILGIVISALDLIHIPFGTLIGVYGLWVLLNKDTEPLFYGTPSTPPAPKTAT
jgi:hypothetical protein